MGSLYYDLVKILRDAGCTVQENSITNGWQKRARSSGGFSSPPLCVFWHHTASQTTVNNDLSYQINGCPDRPVGNLLLDRTGCFWPVAGGASNCAGKGNQMQFSRGVGSANNGNVWGFQIECANGGTGEPWPQLQVDALIRGSNALNAFVGNQPTDITSHALGDGSGYTDRKIDPATSAAVQGPWKPHSVNNNGTWSLPDMRSECTRRAGSTPAPGPGPGPTPPTPTPLPPGGDDEMLLGIYQTNGPALYVCYSGGNKYFITDDGMWDGAIDLCKVNGKSPDPVAVSPNLFAAMGTVIGPRAPGTDDWGNYT